MTGLVIVQPMLLSLLFLLLFSSDGSAQTCCRPDDVDTYVDCFKDTSQVHFHKKIVLVTPDALVPSLCRKLCRAEGHPYAALHMGNQCWCGGTLPPDTDKSMVCTVNCAGDNRYSCGYDSYVDVYKVCPDGRFGESCEQYCNCAGGAMCHYATGACPGGLCPPGWKGSDCNSECDDGRYGPQCEGVCGHCKDEAACNVTDGQCSGCADGWQGGKCQQPCADGWYGPNCVMECGHCRSGAACHKETGYCLGCDSGWKRGLCQIGCDAGRYGNNCEGHCGHCYNDEPCDSATGECANGCAAGWTLSGCQIRICEPEWYGSSCEKLCGHCYEGYPCDTVTGECHEGCDIGWEPDLCTSKCGVGNYGPMCTPCGHCKNDLTCDRISGQCPEGCAPGWRGNACREEQPELLSHLLEYDLKFVAGIGAACVVFVLICLVVVGVITRRCIARRAEKMHDTVE